jgi:hypothetical protein
VNFLVWVCVHAHTHTHTHTRTLLQSECVSPSNLYVEILTPKLMWVLWGWTGHETGALTNRIYTFKTNPKGALFPPCTTWGHIEKAPPVNHRVALARRWICKCSDVGFLRFQSTRSQFLFMSHSVCGRFQQQPQGVKTHTPDTFQIFYKYVRRLWVFLITERLSEDM